MLDGAGIFFPLWDIVASIQPWVGSVCLNLDMEAKFLFFTSVLELLCCSTEIRESSPGFTSLISMDQRMDGGMDGWRSLSSRDILCRTVKHMKLFRPVYIYFQLDQLKALWMIPLPRKLLINKPKLKTWSHEGFWWLVLMKGFYAYCIVESTISHSLASLNIGQTSWFTWMSSVYDLYMQATSYIQPLAQFVFSHWYILSVLWEAYDSFCLSLSPLQLSLLVSHVPGWNAFVLNFCLQDIKSH